MGQELHTVVAGTVRLPFREHHMLLNLGFPGSLQNRPGHSGGYVDGRFRTSRGPSWSPPSRVHLSTSCRKIKIPVYADLVCGLAVIASTVIVYIWLLKVWMSFIAAIITGAASAFFHPSSTAIVPDLVPEDKITNAGLVDSMIDSATEIFASPAGNIHMRRSALHSFSL